MKRNLITLTDSYKVSHYKQYPPNTDNIYSYFESRGGMFDATVFFGLQYFLKEYLSKWISADDIDNAEKLFGLHFGSKELFNRKGWELLLKKHHGRLPVSIKAVPEGTRVENLNVLMTITNTDPAFYWLPNYLETILVQVWYPTTVATLSYNMKRMILSFLERTGDPAGINFKLHDFGFRGVSSVESAAIGGAAHLINFMGTDTMAALEFARDYYGADMPGYSIPAAEHSTITSWGKEREADAYENMLTQYPTGLMACVSDSYDIFNACSAIWGKGLKDKVLARDGVLIIRPDSGYPPEVVVKVLNILWDKFGATKNSKGFYVLNPKIRVIQGDGIDYEMCHRILYVMEQKGWSADNVAFGMGGALLQKLNRDTQSFAFKCSAICSDGVWKSVNKAPITDVKKLSKGGLLKLIAVDGGKSYSTIAGDVAVAQEDVLVEVFRNGKITREYTFDEVRANSTNK